MPGSDPDSEAGPLKQDIIVTTQLLESFNAHSDTWEALEVSNSALDLVINLSEFLQLIAIGLEGFLVMLIIDRC